MTKKELKQKIKALGKIDKKTRIGLNCPDCGRYRDCEEDCPSRRKIRYDTYDKETGEAQI